MNLYVVNKIIQDVMDEHIDYETGEINGFGAEKLEKLGLTKEVIIDEMIKAYKNQQILSDGIDAEINRLKLRKDDLKKTQGVILKQIRPNLEEGKKIETSEYVLKWTTSNKLAGLEKYDPALEFENKESEFAGFVIKKVPDPTYTFDMNAIKKALKSEATVNDVPVDVYINTTKNIKIN